MSELLIVDDDPEPSPTYETVQYPINLETGLAYEGPRADQTLLAEKELLVLERRAVGQLTVAASRILREYEATGEYDDCRVVAGDIMLRRRIVTYPEGDRILQSAAYFYVDKTDGQNYCRSWSDHSEQVNWCYQEERNEPADDVRARLESVFPPIDTLETARRSFGAGVLAKLLRRA